MPSLFAEPSRPRAIMAVVGLSAWIIALESGIEKGKRGKKSKVGLHSGAALA
jgi:hypothetical protein